MSETEGRFRPGSREKARETLVLPRRIMVNIKRDMAEEIGKICYEHEVDILKLIHGDTAVEIVKDPLAHQILIADPDTVSKAQKEANAAARRKAAVAVLYCHHEHPHRWDPEDFDNPNGAGKWVPEPVYVAEEMNRLRGAYGMDEEKKTAYVDLAYPHEANFIEACGGPFKPVKAVAA